MAVAQSERQNELRVDCPNALRTLDVCNGGAGGGLVAVGVVMTVTWKTYKHAGRSGRGRCDGRCTIREARLGSRWHAKFGLSQKDSLSEMVKKPHGA